MYKIKNHFLYEKNERVRQYPSPNYGGLIVPRLLVYHFTSIADLAGTLAILTASDSTHRVSAHLVIDRDGSVVQLLPFNREGWHAGESAWIDKSGTIHTEINKMSIGIEMVNCGQLHQTAQGTLVSTIEQRPVAKDHALLAAHHLEREQVKWKPVNRSVTLQNMSGDHVLSTEVASTSVDRDLGEREAWWELYPQPQINTAIAIACAIAKAYRLEDVVGHDDIAQPVGRKCDPGPAFPLAKVKNSVKDYM